MSKTRYMSPTQRARARRRARAVSLYARGLTLQEVGDRLGVSHETVRTYLIWEGVPLRRKGVPGLPEDKEAAIRRMADEGLPACEIAYEAGVSYSTAWRRVNGE